MTTEELEQMVFNDLMEYLILNGTGVKTDDTKTSINVCDKIAQQQ